MNQVLPRPMFSNQCQKRLSRLFKLRFAILYPFGIWAVFFSYSTDASIRGSIWIILSGLAIRGWANCYAIKMEKLTTSGPYAHVRHPLYLGSFLIIAGFLAMLNVPWFITAIFIFVVIGIVYTMTIRKEEAMLLTKFGQEYAEYRRSVPAFVPTPHPFTKGEKWGASIQRYFQSQEYKLLLWLIIMMIAFHLKEEILVEHERLDIKIISLMIISCLLGMLDLTGEFFRKRRKVRA